MIVKTSWMHGPWTFVSSSIDDVIFITVPGHSPGSIALHDRDNGVLVTGDTLYQTDHGLIGEQDTWHTRRQ